MDDFPIYKDKGIEKHKIASYQMDLKGLATLPVICNFLQEIAGNHAAANGFGFHQMVKAGYIWVLTRLKIEIEKYPKWNDEIFIETWVRNRHSFFSERDFVIYDNNKKKIGGALSGWMMLDLRSRRPKSVEDLKVEIQMFPNDHAVKDQLKKIEPVNEIDFTEQINVKFQDIDLNQHVNNVRYIEWFLDAFPFEFRKTHNVKNFEINFLAEMTFKDSALINTQKIKDNLYRASIINKRNDKEVSRAVISWIKI